MNAIHRLRDVGVDTMYGVAFGEKGMNPADQNFIYYYRRSDATISLEDYCADWATNPSDVRVKAYAY